MTVEVGAQAPDFTLPDYNKEKVSLADFRGKKNVLLVFYPFAFSGVCQGELCQVRDDLSDFENDEVTGERELCADDGRHRPRGTGDHDCRVSRASRNANSSPARDCPITLATALPCSPRCGAPSSPCTSSGHSTALSPNTVAT